ncbi:hypothetical protein [Salipaludibacillus daqingensis]|uniref:hypothetical protein n=1 Tax=Salipaludibacillus daqingensis TaxID=3041001 RepID=UPI00247309F8|nr:hypothetical protein [Salipaludibacillus daqingensis]
MNCNCHKKAKQYPGYMQTPNAMMHQPSQVMGASHPPSQAHMMYQQQPQYGAMSHPAYHHQATQGYANMGGSYSQQHSQPNHMTMNPSQLGQMGFPQQQGSPQTDFSLAEHQYSGFQEGHPYGSPGAGQGQEAQPMMGNHISPQPQYAMSYQDAYHSQPNGYPGVMPDTGYVPEEHDDDFD